MASLVADYGDSEESDGEEDHVSVVTLVCFGVPEKESSVAYGKTFIKQGREEQKGAEVNFFGGGEESSSGDSDTNTEQSRDKTDEAESAETAPKLPNPFQNSKLPSPHLAASEKQSPFADPGSTSSVFINPFAQAEQAKLGILEKHVRLTEAAPQKPASKQVCFKFKKGKCFLGDKCRFFHDRSNIAFGNAGGGLACEDAEPDSGAGFGRGDSGYKFPGFGGGGGGNGGGADGQFYHPAARYSRGQPVDLRSMDDDSYMAAAKGKKRHGITDALVPSKKALTDLEGHRKKERPWTMKK